MSRSLSIECDPVDQPAANDPVERNSWCALRIRVAGRTVTRVWDKVLEQERSLLYVPAFPLAQWLVENWWSLLNEPSPTPEIPRAWSTQFDWIKRHCLRSSDSGLLLPALYIFNDGRGLGIEWQADEAGGFDNMPGEFTDSGHFHLETNPTEIVLSGFVNEIIRRVEGLKDARVKELAEAWRVIQSVDVEEAAFCIAAGRMGVDPYDPSQMSDELAAFIETNLRDPEIPLVRDLTEVARPATISAQWSWAQQTKEAWHLGPATRPPPFSLPVATLSPHNQGYHLADAVRRHAGMAPAEVVTSVATVAGRVTGVPFRVQEQNHVPGKGVRAAVGWNLDREIVVAGPRSPRADRERFLAARGFFHALFACSRSERLVTDAYTWDQQASRAFAAELLAPRAALAGRTGSQADRAQAEELAREFGVSTLLIENQLQNAGIAVTDE